MALMVIIQILNGLDGNYSNSVEWRCVDGNYSNIEWRYVDGNYSSIEWCCVDGNYLIIEWR